jgi:fumarate hydratase class II
VASTEAENELWGAETSKAVENFPVSGEPIPAPVARWLGRIKAAAARVNAELGLLDGDKAERIAAAGDRIANGELDDQFPIDVFQTGSGTSSNMNANEVIATLAGEDVHANDDVNMGQSSNDVFPSAVHLAALDELVTTCCRRSSARRLARGEGGRVRRRRQVGPHALMDAVPVTLGQEFGGYARRCAGIARVERRSRGSARSRSAAPPSAPASTRTRSSPRACARSCRDTGSTISPPADPFESQAARDGSSRPRAR